MLDARVYDEDADDISVTADIFEDENGGDEMKRVALPLKNEEDFKRRAGEVYAEYETLYRRRFICLL